MKCLEFRERITAFLDGALGRAQADSMNDHARECKACADALVLSRVVGGRVAKTLGAGPSMPSVRDEVMRAIRAESSHRPVEKSAFKLFYVSWAAMAAAALFAVLLLNPRPAPKPEARKSVGVFAAGEEAAEVLTLKGVVGRRMFGTWTEMLGLLKRGLDVRHIVTHQLPLSEFRRGLELLDAGQAHKVVLDPAS